MVTRKHYPESAVNRPRKWAGDDQSLPAQSLYSEFCLIICGHVFGLQSGRPQCSFPPPGTGYFKIQRGFRLSSLFYLSDRRRFIWGRRLAGGDSDWKFFNQISAARRQSNHLHPFCARAGGNAFPGYLGNCVKFWCYGFHFSFSGLPTRPGSHAGLTQRSLGNFPAGHATPKISETARIDRYPVYRPGLAVIAASSGSGNAAARIFIYFAAFCRLFTAGTMDPRTYRTCAVNHVAKTGRHTGLPCQPLPARRWNPNGGICRRPYYGGCPVHFPGHHDIQLSPDSGILDLSDHSGRSISDHQNGRNQSISVSHFSGSDQRSGIL